MKRTLKNLFLIIGMFSTGPSMLTAQVIIVDSYYFLMDEIDDNTVDELIGSVRKAVKRYDKFADLIDDQTMKVSQDAIDQFKGLFAQNARVYNDISNRSYIVNYSDYASQINDHLEDGVDFDMFSASVEGIAYDSAGYYEVDVLTRKYLFNGINEEKKPFYCKSGRTFNLRFTYAVPEDDLEEAKILKIQGNLVKECANKPFIVAPEITFGFGDLKYDPSNFYQRDLPYLNLSFNSVATISGGVNFQKPISKRNKFFLSVGAAYEYMRVQNIWNGFYSYGDADVDGTPFTRATQLSDLQEVGNFHAIKLPIGFKYRLLDRAPLHVFFSSGISGHFIVAGSFSHTGNFVTTDYYGNRTVSPNFSGGRLNPSSLSYTSAVQNRRIGMVVSSDLTAQYVLDDSFALDFGFRFSRGVVPFFSSKGNISEIPDALRSEGVSFTEAYLKSIRQNMIEVKLGLIFKK